jgi:hypothetical protein
MCHFKQTTVSVNMSAHIIGFIAFGILFGLLTYGNRHLFGEGPSRREDADPNNGPQGMALWVMICSMLWPILAFTGAYGAWRRAQADRAERVPARRD